MPSSSKICIAGLDEAGCGPWAGPLIAAAVILPGRIVLPGLNDSKRLTAQQRERLYELIVQKTIWSIGEVSSVEIDHFGLSRATEKAYKRAIRGLSRILDELWIDGRQTFRLGYPTRAIVRGDQKIRSIMAASIVAKVTRDRIMCRYAQSDPRYDFELHKGYGTVRHQQALRIHGISAFHRRSYAFKIRS